ncbi:MAG: hypothetical protein FJ194_00445 [Gammaproteobacteria bacterium]|nr:hypothetical protein [Gammaproteobacteria bacterium]
MSAGPGRLRAELLADPIGLPVCAPRLSWLCADSRPAEVMSAWQIQAASSPDSLTANDPDLWDSGIIDGAPLGGVEYAGRGVEPRTAVWWRVRTFDSDGEASDWSQTARFEFSILPDDWSAQWIAAPIHGTRLQSPPVPLLRRRFRVPFQPSTARLIVAAAGACWVWINEREVVLSEVPSGVTDYRRRINYRTIDVDGLVRAGANSMIFLLGDGWLSGFADGWTREHFGNRPELLVLLALKGADDQSLEVGIDAQWEWRPSPLLDADMSRGSAIDGRAFGHDPEYARQKRQWSAVDVISRPDRRLLATAWPGVVSGQPLTAERIERRSDQPNGERRLRVWFPHSITGRLALTLKGRSGDYVRVRYDLERPGIDGPVFDDAVVDTYTLGGDEPREVTSPPFSRRLFRCAEISGDVELRNVLAAEAIPFTDGSIPALHIESDHPLIERLALRLFRSLDLFSQEVLWTGADASRRRIELAAWYPLARLLPAARDNPAQLRASVLEIIANESEPAGLPRSVPALRSRLPAESVNAAAEYNRVEDDFSGGSETVLALVMGLYEHQGDRSILEAVFPFARRLVYALEKSFPNLIRPLDPVVGFADPVHAQIAGTALWHEAILHTARMAEFLELEAQAGTLRVLADRVRSAFQSRFVTPSGLLVRDDQDAYVAALGFGLIDEGPAAVAFARLCELVVQQGYRPLTHTLHGTRLLDVLLAGGRDDLAWAVALRTGPGSWLGDPAGDTDLLLNDQGQIDTGAAALVAWFVTGAAGFGADVSHSGDGAGWRRALIAPRLPVGELFPEGPPFRWLRIRKTTVSGEWAIEWRLSADMIVVHLQIPASCFATVRLPDDTSTRVVSGQHVFRVDLKAADDPIPLLVETL